MRITIAVAADTDRLFNLVSRAAEGMDAEVVRTDVRDTANWRRYTAVIYDTEQLGGEVAEIDGHLDWRLIVETEEVDDGENNGLVENIRSFLTEVAAHTPGDRDT